MTVKTTTQQYKITKDDEQKQNNQDFSKKNINRVLKNIAGKQKKFKKDID